MIADCGDDPLAVALRLGDPLADLGAERHPGKSEVPGGIEDAVDGELARRVEPKAGVRILSRNGQRAEQQQRAEPKRAGDVQQ